MTRRRLLWIGSYTPDSGIVGSAAGVQSVWLDTDSGTLSDAGLAAPSSGPSFVVRSADGGMVYAVNELDTGRVSGFSITGERELTHRGDAPTGGSSPCHLLAHPAGRHLVVANYGDGSLSVHPIGANGVPQEPVQRLTHTGSGPNADRQEGPHAHSVYLAPGGGHLLAVDLGTDELRCLPFDPAADRPAGPQHVAARLAPGSGPRHLAAHSSGHLYVAGELDSRVHVLRFDADTARAETVDTLPATKEPADNFPAEIALSPDERRLYVANRGADTIATFEVSSDGTRLRHLADTPTGGAWPRHFAQVGRYLVVANQNSATLTTLPLDPADGIPGPARHTLDVPTPVCVLPASVD
ncbi:lactonase family protein [Thermobifida halotolerans]|uniref:Lactonase family protein n=1 Tax=Thermobifida halotolerans TaxID=483545 RepID=A0A399FUM7_9ACTN|nr:lactonase family protein [Thermobifida halotolerans]UOE18032.1 lactonase family protein [Thermobifida halotolerans]